MIHPQTTSHLLDPLILGSTFYQDGVVNNNAVQSVSNIISKLEIKYFLINILAPILLLLLMVFVVKYLYNEKKKSSKN